MVEICDGIDNNCNGLIDEGFDDTDNDGIANCIDDDDDNDGCLDIEDPNPLTTSSDSDDDGDADDCDVCPFDADNDIDGDGICGDVDACPNDADNDADGDGICGDVDNCPTTANADQADLDADGIGDVCDAELDICAAFDVLTAYVLSLDLPNNTENHLISKLTKAKNKYLGGNNNAAVGNLGAFINKVNAKTPSQISLSENDYMVSAAQAIIDAINDGTGVCNSGNQNFVNNNPSNGLNTSTISAGAELEIFPNPARDILNIYLRGLEDEAKVRIYDAMGRLVFEQNIEFDQIELQVDLSNSLFQNGLYMIDVISNDTKMTKRLVISK